MESPSFGSVAESEGLIYYYFMRGWLPSTGATRGKYYIQFCNIMPDFNNMEIDLFHPEAMQPKHNPKSAFPKQLVLQWANPEVELEKGKLEPSTAADVSWKIALG